MKKISLIISSALILISLTLILGIPGCKNDENPIKFPYGTFPDSVYNLTGLNSKYDDYNSNIYVIGSSMPIIFSSNRGSNGGQFDLVQGMLSYQFDQTSGIFKVSGEMSNDLFYGSLVSKANTTGNDFGPYSIFSSSDGYEYLFLASQSTGGQLDLHYLKHLPRYSNSEVDIKGQGAVTLLNTSSDDAYITFDSNEDSAYFCSDRGGNFDIYVQKKNATVAMDTWLSQSWAASSLVDSVKSTWDEKCPFVYGNIMVFASNRPGGMGGYDLYYSIFKKGKWGFPVNLGPGINTSSDEFRPLIGYHQDFTNKYLVFSSNRSGGQGGFDLYLTGYTFPE